MSEIYGKASHGAINIERIDMDRSLTLHETNICVHSEGGAHKIDVGFGLKETAPEHGYHLYVCGIKELYVSDVHIEGGGPVGLNVYSKAFLNSGYELVDKHSTNLVSGKEGMHKVSYIINEGKKPQHLISNKITDKWIMESTGMYNSNELLNSFHEMNDNNNEISIWRDTSLGKKMLEKQIGTVKIGGKHGDYIQAKAEDVFKHFGKELDHPFHDLREIKLDLIDPQTGKSFTKKWSLCVHISFVALTEKEEETSNEPILNKSERRNRRTNKRSKEKGSKKGITLYDDIAEDY